MQCCDLVYFHSMAANTRYYLIRFNPAPFFWVRIWLSESFKCYFYMFADLCVNSSILFHPPACWTVVCTASLMSITLHCFSKNEKKNPENSIYICNTRPWAKGIFWDDTSWHSRELDFNLWSVLVLLEPFAHLDLVWSDFLTELQSPFICSLQFILLPLSCVWVHHIFFFFLSEWCLSALLIFLIVELFSQ